MNENNGFIVIHRKILEWKYAQFPAAVTIWVHLLAMANWKPGFFLGMEIPRGSLATSIGALAKRTGLSESTIRRWLKKFEEDGQIERKVTNRCTIIKISNYAAFQDLPDDEVNNQMTGQMTDQVTGQMTDQVTGQMTPNRTRITKKQSNKETRERGNFVPPTLEEVRAYVSENMLIVNPDLFYDHYAANGWTIGGKGKMKDWQAAVRNWDRRDQEKKKPDREREGWAF